MSESSRRLPSSFQPQTIPEMDPVTRIAHVLSSYPSRPAAAAAILSGAHVYSNSSGVPFSRTLLWKTSLLQIDTHRSLISGEVLPHFDLTPLKQHREIYNDLIVNIGIPWHLLPTDSIYYNKLNENLNNSDVEEDLSNLKISKNEIIQNKKIKIKSESIQFSTENDPLNPLTSNNFDSKRKSESDLDVLLTIIADVERLFPEHPQMFIESKQDKIQMIEILFRYVKWLNNERDLKNKKQIGYVQGMHELCGVIYAVLKVELIDNNKETKLKSNDDTNDKINNNDKDNEENEASDLADMNTNNNESNTNKTKNIPQPKLNEKLSNQIKDFLDSDYFMHDVFSMFKELMSPIIDKYFTSSGIVRESIVFDLKLHLLDPGTSKNPGLAAALKDSRIESQLWLTRWFRMLLTRELGLAYSVRVWDGLIAYACVGAMADTVTNGHDVSVLLPYVILLLILRIRSTLLKSLVPSLGKEIDHLHNHNINDDTEALSLLLHYPAKTKIIPISRSTSVEPDSDNDDTNIKSDENIITYRKTRNTHHSNNINKKTTSETILEKAVQIPKLPSAVDLFSDAAHICGLSDNELTQIGPSLIDKYSNGDIYNIVHSLRKNRQSSPFIDGVLKRTKAWRSPSPSSSNKNDSNKSQVVVPTPIDSNRTRLELKLQQRVQNRLRDRSHS